MAAWKLMDPKLIKAVFPPLRYATAFSLTSYSKSLFKPSKKPATVNMLFAVDNVKEWHLQNFAMNKSHYSFIARLTKTRIVSLIQRYGARIHRNHFKTEAGEDIQYWIIDQKDLISDLSNWETMAASSFMQLPNKVLIDDPKIAASQEVNLANAVLFSAHNRLHSDLSYVLPGVKK